MKNNKNNQQQQFEQKIINGVMQKFIETQIAEKNRKIAQNSKIRKKKSQATSNTKNEAIVDHEGLNLALSGQNGLSSPLQAVNRLKPKGKWAKKKAERLQKLKMENGPEQVRKNDLGSRQDKFGITQEIVRVKKQPKKIIKQGQLKMGKNSIEIEEFLSPVRQKAQKQKSVKKAGK